MTWARPTVAFWDLALACLAAEVMADLPHVGDAGGCDGMPLRLQATRHVHRCRAVAPCGARVEKVCGAALFAQHQVVVVHQLGRREAVVQLDQVELARDPRQPARTRSRRPCGSMC